MRSRTPKQLVREFEGTLNYLMGLCALAHKGKDDSKQDLMNCFPFVRGELNAAQRGLERLSMYEPAVQLLAQVEALSEAGSFNEADELVLEFARALREVSGSNDSLRRMYGGHRTDPNVH